MSDLIDRQALLEKKIRIPIARIVTEDKIIYRDVVFVKDIEALPSAQPKLEKNTHSERVKIDKLGVKSGKTCTDTINRQEAIDLITGQPPEPHYPSWYAEQIKGLPSADPKRKRGKWIDSRDVCWLCSECGKWLDVLQGDVDMNFCPNCGSYNGGEQE